MVLHIEIEKYTDGIEVKYVIGSTIFKITLENIDDTLDFIKQRIENIPFAKFKEKHKISMHKNIFDKPLAEKKGKIGYIRD